MKLLSTEIGENSIELTYADNPELDSASTLLVVRLPKALEQRKSIVWNRYWALNDLRDHLNEIIEADRKLMESM